MEPVSGSRGHVRTVLEQLIRERQQTVDEFVEFTDSFARDHGEPGTLSARHLQRLMSGRRSKDKPLGQPQAATARLLERIFERPIAELLSPPTAPVFQSGAHVLRVAVAVVVRDSDLLLVCGRGDNTLDISWQFPAGVVKPGVSPVVVAVRETLAETGVHCVVARELGSRLHPLTNVMCDYVLCEYVGGEASNLDPVENAAVLWVNRARLTRLIPVEHIYPPVLDALDLVSLAL